MAEYDTVPMHYYKLYLANGDEVLMDVSTEEDWGNVQQMVWGDVFANEEKDPEDGLDRVGWGNDSDGHIEIVDVKDLDNDEHLDPKWWAENRVWCYIDCYSCAV